QPPPVLNFTESEGPYRVWRVDLDAEERSPALSPDARAQAFTLWLRSAHFDHTAETAAALIRRALADNPFTTLQVVLEPADSPDTAAVRRQLRPARLETLVAACQESPTYLDKFYALQPGSPNG